MNSIINLRFIRQVNAVLFLTATVIHSAWAGQVVTGKIIIDGVIVGDGNNQVVNGSAIMAHEKRQVGAFDRVITEGSIDIRYQQSAVTNVEISGDQTILPLIKIEANAGLLRISSTESYQSRLPIVVTMSAPHIKQLTMNGAGDAELNDLDEDEFKLELNGSGNVVANGRAGEVIVKIDGSGDVNAKNLISQKADVSINGSGNLALTTSQYLKTNLVGSGDVTYYGHPKQVEKQMNGSGEIKSGDAL
ncbi:MAG: head GIN domain-containing protein [Methyloglobulus sp.]|nr:DUF2807 domain-containing protein [Methyloglobulus sp.]